MTVSIVPGSTLAASTTSSTELSEAINSMFRWYENAEVCYAYLKDMPPLGPHLDKAEFRKAKWFTRGGCLQELIALQNVEFYAMNWTEIGIK